MAYSTQTDVEQAAGGAIRLLQLVDWDNNNAIDAARLAAAIAKADSLIDSYAVKHYKVPFATVPPIITTHSADLAMLYLVRSRGPLSDVEQDLWDSIAGTDEKKPGWLLLLAKGIVTLGVDPAPPASEMVVDQVETAMPTDRDVSREKLAGWW